jgi:hypothetical protein
LAPGIAGTSRSRQLQTLEQDSELATLVNKRKQGTTQVAVQLLLGEPQYSKTNILPSTIMQGVMDGSVTSTCSMLLDTHIPLETPQQDYAGTLLECKNDATSISLYVHVNRACQFDPCAHKQRTTWAGSDVLQPPHMPACLPSAAPVTQQPASHHAALSNLMQWSQTVKLEHTSCGGVTSDKLWLEPLHDHLHMAETTN